jgi:hypothetical protein
MKELADHELKLRVKGSQYIALRHLADADERPLSSYLRKLISDHLDQVSTRLAEMDRDESGRERDA